jgi:hypothetical protein
VKYLILEHKKDGIQVIDEDGYFHFIRGFTDCPIGSEIELPDERKDDVKEPHFQRPVNMRQKVLAGLATTCVCVICFLAGWWSNVAYYVEINGTADIEMAFNDMGIVVSVSGLNDEGEELLTHERLLGHRREAIETALLAVEGEGAHVVGAGKGNDNGIGNGNGNGNGNDNGDSIASNSGAGNMKFIEVTIVARSVSKAMDICEEIAPYLAIVDPNGEIEIDTEYCDMAKRDAAMAMGVSAGKLLLAEHLHDIKPEMLVDEITRMPIEEIYADIFAGEAGCIF